MKIEKILTDDILQGLEFKPCNHKEYCKSIGNTTLSCYKNAGGYWSVKITPTQPIQYDRIATVEGLKQFIEYTCKSEEESANVIQAMENLLQ